MDKKVRKTSIDYADLIKTYKGLLNAPKEPSARVKAFRKWLGKTQAQFATDLGREEKYLSQVENREDKNIPPIFAKRIAARFPEVTEAWLLGYTDYPNKDVEEAANALQDVRDGANSFIGWNKVFASLGVKTGITTDAIYMKRDGKTIKITDESEWTFFINDLIDYTDYKLKKLFERHTEQ